MLKLTDQDKQEIIPYLETDKELPDCSGSFRTPIPILNWINRQVNWNLFTNRIEVKTTAPALLITSILIPWSMLNDKLLNQVNQAMKSRSKVILIKMIYFSISLPFRAPGYPRMCRHFPQMLYKGSTFLLK